MSTEIRHDERPRGGISEADGELDSLGRVIGSDEEHEAFLTWLYEWRRMGRLPAALDERPGPLIGTDEDWEGFDEWLRATRRQE